MLLNSMVEVSFNFSSLIMYISGIITGFIIAVLVYILIVLVNINKKRRIIEASQNISEKEVREMIERARENYKLLSKSKDSSIKDSAYKETILTLINDIASKCFPKSKNPTLELSIDESLLLVKYIVQRVEELLDKRVFSIVKRISIKRITSIITMTRKIENNVVVKEVKKYSKIVKIGMTVVNAVTKPFKLIGGGIKNLLINKILVVTIGIVGEEAYKIYTKQAIKSMDPEYQKLMEEIDLELDQQEKIEVE